ncbi:MAG: ABC transporter substrate-binding protein, partial [Methanophagales archaeon]|nr:ABC transporter substrate-binding protein [Methanophagales archaeon]
GKEKELTLIDGNEQVKTFNLPIKRIVVLDDAQGEPLRVLGAVDLVVGVGTGLVSHPIILPEMSKLPIVGGWGTPDYEKIIELKTDLVYVFSGFSMVPDAEEKLESYGVHILRLDCYPIGISEDLTKLGYLVGKKDRAKEVAEFYEGYLDKIREGTEGLSGEDKPHVYLERSFGKYITTGVGSKPDMVCTVAGGINIAHDLTGHLTVDPEWVVEQNPDIIVKGVSNKICGYGVDNPLKVKAARDEIMNRPELANVNAVKNGKVYVASCELTLSGLHEFIWAGYCAKWFHPELFEDLDLQAIHQEYIDRFLRIDYDLDKHGVFVYPEEPV